MLIAQRFLNGEIILGGAMQVAMTFVQAQAALNWFVGNSARLAEEYASVVRVVALEEALGQLGGSDAVIMPAARKAAADRPSGDHHLRS